MERSKAKQLYHKSNNLNQYYEYRVYDKNIGYSSEIYSECPVVVMSRHQGFQWNEELFASAYRRSAGYECHKSKSLLNREQKIIHSTNQNEQRSNTEVIDINLTDEECDVWP